MRSNIHLKMLFYNLMQVIEFFNNKMKIHILFYRQLLDVKIFKYSDGTLEPVASGRHFKMEIDQFVPTRGIVFDI